MTTPPVSAAITVSLQVSNEPVYTTVTSSSIPAEISQTPVTPSFVYTTPTGRCVHRASCKHLKAFTRAMHICSCVMRTCTLVLRPFVVEKPIRNAVTAGLLVKVFLHYFLLVCSMKSFVTFYGLSNRPYATNG